MKKIKILFTLLFILNGILLVAQTSSLEDNGTYLSGTSADITHPEQVRLTPGFHAYEGSNVHVFISGWIDYDIIPGGTIGSTEVSPTGSMNYIVATSLLEAENDTSNIESNKRAVTINYFDGLGRAAQSVNVQASPSNYDIVQPIAYDEFGREEYKYLPYQTGSNTGEFKGSAITECTSFYSTGFTGYEPDGVPYSKTIFDDSPLNRVDSLIGIGSNWHNGQRAVQIKYLCNTTTDAVKYWTVSESSGSNVYSGPNTYPENSLYVTETIDEDGNSTKEFKDKQGRIVCKKANDGSAWLATYYVYDDFGLLRCVVPPLANGAIVDDLCYHYRYDHRQRMIEKDLPGAAKVYMVYDVRDRLVMVQDGNHRANNQWISTEYDNLNRPVKTGIVTTSNSFDDVASAFANVSTFPYTTSETYSETYYDDYGFTADSKYDFDTYISEGLTGLVKSTLTRGMVTGTKSAVLQNQGDNISPSQLLTLIYYDDYGRQSRVITDNHLGGFDVVDNLYNFSGQLTHTLLRHKRLAGSETLLVNTWHEYDHQGRLLSEKMQVNEEDVVTLAAYGYNEIGTQIVKYLHGSSDANRFSQKVDYAYNIRGWLRKINGGNIQNDNDLFAMELQYETLQDIGNMNPSENFNGNISAIKWETDNGEGAKGYGFDYDGLNRLTRATFGEGGSYAHTNNNDASYTYDANGNLKTLNRYLDGAHIDELTYNYENSGLSNRLASVTDPQGALGYTPGVGSYGYDANGNMAADPSKGLSEVIYNYLNLPSKIVFSNNDNIRYIYSADGVKLRKAVTDETGLIDTHNDYLGSLVYEDNNLKAILTSVGRVVPEVSGQDVLYKYEYNLTDHLGNVRAVFRGTDNGSPELVQTTDYFPFGMVMDQQNLQIGGFENNYLYNGKELQNDLVDNTKLNWYDYGARMYDAELGRWHIVDPLEQFDSPYTFVGNNPISFNDPTGMWSENIASTFVDEDGNIIEHRDDGDPRVYEVKDEKDWREKGSKKKDAKHVGYEYPGIDYDRPGEFAVFYKSTRPYFPGHLNDGPIQANYVEYDICEIVFTGGGLILFRKGGKWLVKKLSKEAIEEIAELTAKSVDDKLARYLLNTGHEIGRHKAKWFEKALGFTKDNASDLAKQIRFDPKKATQIGTNQFGTKYNQVIRITGANGRKIDVTFGWIKNKDGVPRLVTAIPTK